MPFPLLSSPPSRISQSGHLAVEEERHVKTSHCVRPYSNEEELKQEDWRSRYIQLLSRSQKWEKTIQLKDSTLQYLRQALQDRHIALKRQEKLIEETKQRLHFQGKSEKAQLEKKELEVSLLRAKALQQAEKLAEQAKLVGVLNHRQEKREQELSAYSHNVIRKVEKLKVRLQSAEASLQSREEELEAYKKCCNDMKIIIWKKDRMLERSKRLEEQLQLTLKRKHLENESLEAANIKLRGQYSQMIKNITEIKRNSEAALQQDVKLQVFCLQKQKDQTRRLELILGQKESCLEAKSRELEASYKETERLAEEYGMLKKKYESLTRKHAQLQIMLRDLELKMNTSYKGEVGSSHTDFLEEGSFPAQCRGVNNDGFNLAYEHKKAGPSMDVEDLVGTRTSRPCLDGVSTPTLLQYCSKYGVSQVGSGARPGMKNVVSLGGYLSSFEEDLHDEQHCSSNQLETKAQLSADQFKSENVDSLNARSSELPLTSFPKPAGPARNKWRLSDQVFILAEDNSCMETKAELNNTKKAVQSTTSPELQKIQEEIEERERRWKQIEASMRAELSRRKVQLHEATQRAKRYLVLSPASKGVELSLKSMDKLIVFSFVRNIRAHEGLQDNGDEVMVRGTPAFSATSHGRDSASHMRANGAMMHPTPFMSAQKARREQAASTVRRKRILISA